VNKALKNIAMLENTTRN